MKKYFSILCAVIIFILCSCSESPTSKTGFYFDTIITITIYDECSDDTFKGAFELCEKYESLLSKNKEGSDIWNINHSEGTSVDVDPETAFLISKALYYCELSDGAFDITIAPASELWDFSSSDTHVIPDSNSLARAISYVNYRNVSVTGNTVSVPEGTKLDLGAAAKGYIADRLKDFLKEHGIDNAIINLGGNIYAIGDKNGSPFKVGIRSPFDTSSEIAYVYLSDKSAVTSGIYERCFTIDGVKYHHLLDTKTGMPLNNTLASVTVFAQSSTDCDILSTTCYLLGEEKALELIDSLPSVDAFFIRTDGTFLQSDSADVIIL